jgi:hypothetical protein
MKRLEGNVDYRGLHTRLTKIESFINGVYKETTNERIVSSLKLLLREVEVTKKTASFNGLCSISLDVCATHDISYCMLHELLREHYKQIADCSYVTGYWWNFKRGFWTIEKWYAPRIKFVKMLINFYKKQNNENKIKNRITAERKSVSD